MRASPSRRVWSLAMLLGGAVLSLSCGGDGGSPSPTPTNVLVSPGADTLVSIGETQAFTASVLDANGDPIDGAAVTWSSDAPGVVTIDAGSGVATAIANGTAHVKATTAGLEGSASLVVAQIVASVTVTPGNVAFTSVGDTARFTAVAKDAGNTVVPGVQILWSVSDNAVATVDTLGLAKAKGAGNALVTAQAQTRAGFAAIGVDPTVTQFAIINAPATAVAGEVPATALQVELRDARGNRAMNASLAVTVAAGGAASGTPLHGASSVLADQGRATFSTLWFEKSGIARFKVTVGALPVDSSSVVDVAPGAPAVVALLPIDTVQTAGVPVGLTALVKDQWGNQTTYGGTVIATAVQRAPSGIFFGDSVTPASEGDATFYTLNFQKAEGPWRLTAYLPGIPTRRDTTPAMVVHPAAAATVSIAHLGRVALGVPLQDSTVIVVTDAFGNPSTVDLPGPFPYVLTETSGWPFSADSAYAQRVRFGDFTDVIDGKATINIGVARAGRIRLIFSVPGLLPDTTDEIVPALPAPVMFGTSGRDQSGLILTGDATCFFDEISLCAGDNAHGELGIAATVAADSLWIPVDSASPGIPGGGDGGDHHACATVGDFYTGAFSVICWGDNAEGQLGNGSVGGTFPDRQGVVGLTSVLAPYISAGSAHTCAIFDGAASCWGKNDVGQLGNGAVGASTGTPTSVTGGHTFIQISAGGRHTCAIDDAQGLWCWGANDFGQVGDSGVSGAFSADPVQIRPDLQWYSVAAGDEFTCGQLVGNGSTAQVYCWGRNDRDQFGYFDDGAPQSTVPRLAGLFNGSSNGIAAGAQFVCAAFTGGAPNEAVYCWGANERGQLGRGSVSVSDSMPVPPIAVPQGVEMVLPVVGRTHACALTAADPRKVICWGENGDGRLGIGRTAANEPTPVLLQDEY